MLTGETELGTAAVDMCHEKGESRRLGILTLMLLATVLSVPLFGSDQRTVEVVESHKAELAAIPQDHATEMRRQKASAAAGERTVRDVKSLERMPGDGGAEAPGLRATGKKTMAPQAREGAAAAQILLSMMTRAKPPTCDTNAPPVAATVFPVTEPQIYLWFAVSGVAVGDVFASQYYTPSGQLYAPASGPWPPSATSGSSCLTDTALVIAGATPATLPGLWTVRVTLNNVALFTLTFTIGSAPASSPATLQLSMMTRTTPATCDFSAPPVAVTSVPATESQLVLWFAVRNVRVNDVFSSEYYTPAGALYAAASGPWQPAAASGDRCYSDKALAIAGASPATLPGVWTVKVKLNNNAFFSLTFTITAPAPPASVTVPLSGMTRAKPATCSLSAPPTFATSFTATEAQILLWFMATNVKVGDVFASEYYTPSGQLYTPVSGAWVPSATAGDFCYSDNPFVIAGSAPASQPGTWTVKVKLNGAPLFSTTFTIAAACTFSLNPTSKAFDAGGGSGSFSVSAAAGCAWTAVSGGSWVVISSGASGSGNGTVNYTVSANTGASRTANIVVAGQNHAVSQAALPPPPPASQFPLTLMIRTKPAICDFNTPPVGASSFLASETQIFLWFAAKSVRVGDVFSSAYYSPSGEFYKQTGGAWEPSTTAGDKCYSDAAFQIAGAPPASQLGQWTVKVSLNGVQVFTVSFTIASGGSGCTYSLSPSSNSIDAGGGPGSISVSAGAGCTWTAVSGATWITVLSGSSGSSGGTVLYTVAANPDGARTGTITVGGQTFTVSQATVVTAVDPSSVIQLSMMTRAKPGVCDINAPPTAATSFASTEMQVFLWFYAQSVKAGDVFSSEYYAPNGQFYAPTSGAWPPAASSDSWCYLDVPFLIAGSDAANLPGVWTVRIKLNGNLVATRTFLITSGTSCSSSLDSSLASMPSGGSSGSVKLTTGASCTWTVQSSAAWLTLLSPASGTGSATVNYSVAANTDTQTRTGRLVIAGLSYTVTQAAASVTCSYSISPASAAIVSSGGTASVTVTTNTACSWVAASPAPWIAIATGSTSGKGNGKVTYTVTANSASAARSATLTVAGQPFTVTQAGASISLGVITTFAGTTWQFDSSPKAGTDEPLGSPEGMSFDSNRNLYIADTANCLVLRLAADGTMQPVAGNGFCAYSGDGGPATNASLNGPRDVAADSRGNIFIADYDNNRIRKVAADGTISTIGGTGRNGSSGDGGPATSADIGLPYYLALDSRQNLYVITRNRVRRIGVDGTVQAVAGTGDSDYSGDGGPATAAKFRALDGIAISADDVVYLADSDDNRIRRVSGGTVSTFAGNGKPEFSGDGGPATAAGFSGPEGLAFDKQGALYVADRNNYRVRKIGPDGTVTSIAGSDFGFSGDGGDALKAQFRFPHTVTVDPGDGSLFVADTTNMRVRRVGTDSTIRTVAGNGKYKLAGPNAGPEISYLSQPKGLAFDSKQNLYVVDAGFHVIWRIGPDGVAQFAGLPGVNACCGDTGTAVNGTLSFPADVVADSDGSVFIADTGNARIRKVTPDGKITTYAGNGVSGICQDAAPATNACLSGPQGIALDSSGNLLVTDSLACVVSRITPGGSISRVAGNGKCGYGGDSGPAVNAQLENPWGVTVLKSGDILIADSGNHRIRRVDASGNITTLAGDGTARYAGDGSNASKASLSFPTRILADDATGDLYIADTNNAVIRRISSNNLITTVVGIGQAGFTGDGGPANTARLNAPIGLARDNAGRLFVSDYYNNRIRLVTGTVTPFTVSSKSLSFKLGGDGQVPPSQSVTLTAGGTALHYATTLKSGSAWLRVTPSEGSTPATVQVSVDPTGLQPGNYSDTILFNGPLGVSESVDVRLTLDDANPPRLSLEPQSIDLTLLQGGRGEQVLFVVNRGGGQLQFKAAVPPDANWALVTGVSGPALPATPGTATINVDASTLPVGTSTTTLVVTNTTTNETANVTVNVTVTAAQKPKMLVSQRQLSFLAPVNSTDFPQSIGILNIGDGPMPWTANVSSGADWLTISPAGGNSDAQGASVPLIQVMVKTGTMRPGTYNGTIQVRAPGADDGSQNVAVTLVIVDASVDLGVALRPTGMIWVAGSGSPVGSQTVEMLNRSSQARPWDAFVGPKDAEGWFDYSPYKGSLDPITSHAAGVKAVVNVQPQSSSSGPAIRTGTMTLKFGSQNSNVNLLLFVPGAPSASDGKAQPAANVDCSTGGLSVLFTELAPDFQLFAGRAVTLKALVVNGCGAPVVSGTVVASFSTGDSALPLISLKNGTWVATWNVPQNYKSSRVSIRVRAVQAGTSNSGNAEISGNIAQQ